MGTNGSHNFLTLELLDQDLVGQFGVGLAPSLLQGFGRNGGERDTPISPESRWILIKCS
jgi:hypothetical protein